MNDGRQAGRPTPGSVGDYLSNENPVFRYAFATLIVFGSLYVANYFGVPIAWPIALLIGLGMLLFCQGDACPLSLAKKRGNN